MPSRSPAARLSFDAGYEVLRKSTGPRSDGESFAADLLLALSQRPRRIPSKYLYDAAGSRAFQQITRAEDYYLTRCERDILERHGAEIAATLDEPRINLVDFGAGDGHKTHLLLEKLLAAGIEVEFVPIDICEHAMQELVEATRRRLPGLRVRGLVADYFEGLEWLADETTCPSLVLFLGSNVGNFEEPRAREFLQPLRRSLRRGDTVLLGFDLKKDIDELLRAYDDREGLTREFNLNLLRRINRELDGEFELSGFRHYRTYNAVSGAMESYLISTRRQEVWVGALERSFRFEAWEPIQTEYSHKYLESEIESMAEEHGFSMIGRFVDSRGYFLDALWRVR